MIKVLLVEDQAMVRGALKALLSLEADIEIAGDVGNATEAVQWLANHACDIVLTDIELSGESGLDLAKLIQQQHSDIRTIIVTTFARSGFLRRALDAGVRGYLLKDAPAQQLAEAIRSIHRGGRIIDPELAAAAWEESDPLTDRERAVLRQAAEGFSTAEIADKIHLSEGTVRNYLSEAMAKLGAKNRVDAARLAREKGWL